MINIGTKLPDFMKLKGIRQSPLPQCVLEIVITVVAHLVSTSRGYYMNQLPAIDRPRSCTRLCLVSPLVVSDVSTNRRLGSSGSGPVSSKTPSALLLKMALILWQQFCVFPCITSYLQDCGDTVPHVLKCRQVLSSFLRHSALLYGLGIFVYLGTSPQHVQSV